MYTNFKVAVFRGLRNTEFKRLTRVNVITGKNAVGKSSVLEAIHAHAHPADLTNLLQMDSIRMGVNYGLTPPLDYDSVPWKTLFGNFTQANKIVLGGTFADQYWEVELISERELNSVTFSESEKAQIQPFLQQSPIAFLRVRTTLNDEHWDAVAIAFMNGGVNFFNIQTPHRQNQPELRSFRMPASMPTTFGGPASIAAQYSRLVERDGDKSFLEALRTVDPRIERLLVWTNGSVSRLHADIGERKILDLSLISDGLRRIAMMTLGVADSTGGAFLLDEVENGIHYSSLEGAWRALNAASIQYNTQLFVTTHSRECVEAAFNAIPDSEAIMLHRLEATEEKTEVFSYDRHMISAAFDAELEFR